MRLLPTSRRHFYSVLSGSVLVFFLTALPALAADDNTPDPADSPVGMVFRWLNFLLVMGGIAYLVGKFGAPYFRSNAKSISNAIREAGETRAQAEKELREVDAKVGALNLEIQDMRRAAANETTAEAERIRQNTQTELEKIFKATYTEIQASERASRQELRAIAARLATERAAVLVREQINAEAEAAIFQTFVGELERSHQ